MAEPVNVLPLKLKVAVVALALTALVTRATLLLNWLGRVSLMVPLKVDGPALLTTKVKLVVPPAATVVEPTSLATPRLTTGVTEMTALTVAELVPTDVVREPAGIVFVNVPPIELVTTTVTVQVDA